MAKLKVIVGPIGSRFILVRTAKSNRVIRGPQKPITVRLICVKAASVAKDT